MDYEVLLKNLKSFTQEEFSKKEYLLCAVLKCGNNSDKSKSNLPDAVIALITLGVWAESSHELAKFYSEHNRADIKTTKKYLKSRADKELLDMFACGIHDYKNPLNAALVGDWIAQSYTIENWINKNDENRKKLDNLRFEIFTKNIGVIESIIQSAVTPFNEALKNYADELSVCLMWQLQLNQCAADNGDAEAKYNLSKFYIYAPKRSLECLTEAAKQGWAAAQHELGEYYYEHKKFEQAAKWFSLADEQGYAKASYAFSKMYLDGKGVKKDVRQGMALLEQAAENGDCEAYYLLACAYENGKGKEIDYEKAIEYYSAAAVLGSRAAGERLNKPEYIENESNIKKLTPLAKKGNPCALYALSCFWEFGCDEYSRERDAKKAAEIWQKQADDGNAEAQYLSGLCYLTGTGVEEDAKKALSLFEKAAQNGYIRALTEIGDMYKHGNGVKFSDKRGNDYYLKAAELGDADVYILLAYWLDKLGEKDNARKWRIKAATLGYRNAQFALAESLLKGTKTAQRLKDADVKLYIDDDLLYFDTILEAIKDKLPQ